MGAGPQALPGLVRPSAPGRNMTMKQGAERRVSELAVFCCGVGAASIVWFVAGSVWAALATLGLFSVINGVMRRKR